MEKNGMRREIIVGNNKKKQMIYHEGELKLFGLTFSVR